MLIVPLLTCVWAILPEIDVTLSGRIGMVQQIILENMARVQVWGVSRSMINSLNYSNLLQSFKMWKSLEYVKADLSFLNQPSEDEMQQLCSW